MCLDSVEVMYLNKTNKQGIKMRKFYITNGFYKNIFEGLVEVLPYETNKDNTKHPFFNTFKILENKFLSFYGDFTTEQLECPALKNQSKNIISYYDYMDLIYKAKYGFSFEIKNEEKRKQVFNEYEKRNQKSCVYYVENARTIEDIIIIFKRYDNIDLSIDEIVSLDSTQCKTTICNKFNYEELDKLN